MDRSADNAIIILERSGEMALDDELELYLDRLAGVLGHADRRIGLVDYCRGLMLPIKRKSIEPLAAHVDPLHVQAKHQSLHHFVAKSAWSDDAVLTEVRSIIEPVLGTESGSYWIIDDTGIPKQGKHSVGVTRQYCGQLGKTENCQVAVSLSLASNHGSLPIAWQLYLPEEWASDRQRCRAVGIPDDIAFATKNDIALAQVKQALAAGVTPGTVLADPAYGDSAAFRDQLTEWGLTYAVGTRSTTSVWPPGVEPLPPIPTVGRGRPSKNLRRAPGHMPVSVKELAMSLPESAYQAVSWREGTNDTLTSRFATVRVRTAYKDYWRSTLRPEEWLLIEWPEDDAEPLKYFLSTLPVETLLDRLVFVTKMRWRIERDYRELKQEFGLGQYEGRNWRGLHHHATLCIAAYGFLLHKRLTQDSKKNGARPQTSALPEGFVPRGSGKSAAACAGFDRLAAASHRSTHRKTTHAMSMLRNNQSWLVTQSN
jgi:SRSO17 transposase